MATPKTTKTQSKYEAEAKEYHLANATKATIQRNYAVPEGVYSQINWLDEKIRELKIKQIDCERGTSDWRDLDIRITALSRIKPEFKKLEGKAAEFFLKQAVEDHIRTEWQEAEDPVGAKEYKEIRRKSFEDMQKRMAENRAREVEESGFNRYWFREQLANHNLTQRAFATHLNIDPAAVSYMLQGRRRVSLDEAKKIADLFGVNTTEVMRQAGVQVTEDAPIVTLRGFTKDGSEIEWLESSEHKQVPAPYDAGKKSFAIQDRTGDRPTDGWLYYVSGEHLEPANNLDRLVLLKLGSGEEIFGIVKKGYAVGQYNVLLSPELKKTLHEQTVEYVSPVIWIKPSNITWAAPG